MAVNSVPPVLIVAGAISLFLCLFFALYAILTKRQRRITREIRVAATELGWKYRVRHWQGNPAAFRIEGQTTGGIPWILTSSNSSSSQRDWAFEVLLRFPMLGGETDLVILPPNNEEHGTWSLGAAIPPEIQSRIAAFSATLGGIVGFFRDAQELPSGFAAFDSVYKVLALTKHIQQSPIESALAHRILQWPTGTIAPHSVLALRDPFAFEFQARLPGPPNAATVLYFLSLATDLIAQLPPPRPLATPTGLVDGLLSSILK